MDAWSFAHHQTICACKCPDCLMVGFSCWIEKASKPMAPVEQRRGMARVIRREFWLQKSFFCRIVHHNHCKTCFSHAKIGKSIRGRRNQEDWPHEIR